MSASSLATSSSEAGSLVWIELLRPLGKGLKASVLATKFLGENILVHLHVMHTWVADACTDAQNYCQQLPQLYVLVTRYVHKQPLRQCF